MKKLLLLTTCWMLFLITLSNAQLYKMEGRVTDESGAALIGASVMEKGTKIGTVTDVDGRFTLMAKDSLVELVISYVGYTTVQQKAQSGQPLQISLMSAGNQLNEVVIVGRGVPSSRPRKATRATIADAPMSYRLASPSLAMEYNVDFNTEDYSVINENRFFAALQNPVSTFSIDVDAASYSNIRRFIQQQGQLPPKDAVRIEEMINYFNYDYPQPKGEHPVAVITEISECPWQPQHRLLHVGLQGKSIATENLPASNLVFLIDVSGSMNTPNRLPLVKASMKLLIDQLREQDRVSIVVYAGAAGLVLPPTSGADKAKIREAIDQLQAGGSTAGGAGIQLAYKTAREHFIKGGNNRIILATDGDFNVGASSDAELVRMVEKERAGGVFLTVLGYGMGNYKDNKMQQLANKGNGNHAYIDNLSEAKKVLVNEFGGTLFTIAKDVKLQIEFNPVKVQGYRLIGYENRLLNREDFNDDAKDAGELGAGHTVTALYEIIPTGVESAFIAKADDLKYQPQPQVENNSKELCTIKLRYKEPDGEASKLIEQAVLDARVPVAKASEHFRWSAAVAEFGMLLRDSEFKGTATYAHCLALAKSAQGKDPHGYRREMIELLDITKSLVEPEVAGKE